MIDNGHAKIYKNEYVGISYPKLFQNKLVQWLWKKFMCPKGRHLLDEVWGIDEHYLYCDACKRFYVFIDEVIEESEKAVCMVKD